MADRYPLIVDSSAEAIKELPSGDAILFLDNEKIKVGTGSDLTLYHDASNSYITNAVGALKVATETSGIAVTIGHTTSETTVADNLTVTGDFSVGGNFDVTGTLDFSDSDITNAGDIQLDSITGDGDTNTSITFSGSDVTLSLTKAPLHENATSVYIDGVYQSKDNYAVSGTTLTFSTAPPSGTAVECMTGNNGTVATLFNVVNKAGSNIACAILNAAITVVGKSGNITVGVT